MPNEVKDRVSLLARRQKANPGLIFLDRHRLPYADEADATADAGIDADAGIEVPYVDGDEDADAGVEAPYVDDDEAADDDE